MLFGEELAKQATTTVDQLKAIRKCNKDEKSFSSHHPLKIPPLQPGIQPPSSTPQPPRSKQRRRETLAAAAIEINHGLHML